MTSVLDSDLLHGRRVLAFSPNKPRPKRKPSVPGTAGVIDPDPKGIHQPWPADEQERFLANSTHYATAIGELLGASGKFVGCGEAEWKQRKAAAADQIARVRQLAGKRAFKPRGPRVKRLEVVERLPED